MRVNRTHLTVSSIVLIICQSLAVSLTAGSLSWPTSFAGLGQRSQSATAAALTQPNTKMTDPVLTELTNLEQTFKQCLDSIPNAPDRSGARQICQDNYLRALSKRYYFVPEFILVKQTVTIHHLLEAQGEQPTNTKLTDTAQINRQELAQKIAEWEAYDLAHRWW